MNLDQFAERIGQPRKLAAKLAKRIPGCVLRDSNKPGKMPSWSIPETAVKAVTPELLEETREEMGRPATISAGDPELADEERQVKRARLAAERARAEADRMKAERERDQQGQTGSAVNPAEIIAETVKSVTAMLAPILSRISTPSPSLGVTEVLGVVEKLKDLTTPDHSAFLEERKALYKEMLSIDQARAAVADGSGSVWTPAGVCEIISVASPMLREGLDMLRASLGMQPPAVPPSVNPAGPVVPSAAPQGALKPEDLELVDIGITALRGKDFPTFLAAYETVRALSGGMIPPVDHEVSPALYVTLLGRFDARFRDLADELKAFLAWLAEDAKRETVQSASG